MADLKLFELQGNRIEELLMHSVDIEKSLQTLMEQHLEQFLGVRFVVSEHPTGRVHGGRIDTLGLDENNCPVIIEYKRAINQNVMSQGLSYLNWLMDHQAEFVLLVQRQLGKEQADKVEWSGPRVLCIAADFTKHDSEAVHQMGANIELIRYRMYGDRVLALELLNFQSTTTTKAREAKGAGSKIAGKAAIDPTAGSSKEFRDRYESLRAFVLAMGGDIEEKHLKRYVAFKRMKNFLCVEPHPAGGWMLLFLKVNPDTVSLEPGFSRDVRKIGHWGTGDLEVRVRSDSDLERAKAFIVQSYNNS